MKNTVSSVKRLLVIASFSLLPVIVKAQQISVYAFSKTTSQNINRVRDERDGFYLNKESVSSSNTVGNVYNDLDLGFDFTFMGNTFRKVSFSSKGFLALGQSLSSTHPDNSLSTTSLNNIIAPLWDDLRYVSYTSMHRSGLKTETGSLVKYRVFEWKGMVWGSNQNALILFQARLFEDGRIMFLYQNYNKEGQSGRSASAGLKGSQPGQFLSINFTTHALEAFGTENANNTDRPSKNDEIVRYTFTPPPPAEAPKNLTVERKNYFSVTLTWNAASGIDKYAIFRADKSTSGTVGNFTYLNTVNANSFTDPTTLQASQNYVYRVHSVKETRGQSQDVVADNCFVNPATGQAFNYFDGMRYYYKMNGDGTEEISGNNGILIGNPTTALGSDNYQHAAMSFNGTNQFMATSTPIPTGSQAGSFTLSAKFKTSATSGGTIISFGNSQNSSSTSINKHIYINSNGVVFFGVLKSGASSMDYIRTSSSGTKYNDGLWHSVTATFSSTQGMRLFIDGIQISSLSIHNSVKELSGSGYWKVGFDQGMYFKGDIDEVFIFDEELTTSKIYSLVNSVKTAGYINVACINTEAVFLGPTETGATYSWVGPNGFKSSAQNPTFKMTSDRLGIYELTVTKGHCIYTYRANLMPYTDAEKGIWSGNESSSFANVLNWCGGELPPPNVVKRIKKVSGTASSPIVDLARDMDKIRVENEGVLTIGNGGNLRLDEVKIDEGGKLQIYYGGQLGIKNVLDNSGELDATYGKVSFFGTTAISLKPNVFKNGLIKHLELKNSAKISLASSLSLSGTLTALDNAELLSNGHLTISATETDQGQIAPIAVGAKISGVVEVENFIKGGDMDQYRGFRMLSSSVYDLDENSLRTYKVRQLQDDILITGEGGVVNGFDNSRHNNASAWTYGETGYEPVTSLDTKIAAGRGVYVYYRGDKSEASEKIFGPFPSTVESKAINFSGTLNQQNITVNINNTRTDGYALLGNPYASPISVKNLTKSNLGGNYWTFNPGDKNYVLYNSISNIGVNDGKDVIGVGQGFFTDITNANATVTFKETDKIDDAVSVQSSANENFITSNLLVTPRSVLRLAIKPLVSYGKDEIALVFENGGNANFTAKDAEHWDGEIVNLSSFSEDGKKLAINFMPQLTGNTSVKLSIKASMPGNYTIQFNTSEFYTTQQAKLKDKYLGNSVPIYSGMNYQFTIDLSNEKSFGDDRFSIDFEEYALLPVKLIKFVGNKEGERIKLVWQVENQTGDELYQINRKDLDGNSKLLSVVKADDLNNYTVYDSSPNIGNNYYELSSTTVNGVDKVLGFSAINYAIGDEIQVYPNPFKEVLNIRLKNVVNGFYEVKLVDLTGKVLISKTTTAKKLAEGFPINTSSLKNGLYVLSVVSKTSGEQLHSSSVLKSD